MARTLIDKLLEAKDRPSGFDYLRLLLAVSIVAWHGVVVCYGIDVEARIWQGPAGPFIWFLVPSLLCPERLPGHGKLSTATICRHSSHCGRCVSSRRWEFELLLSAFIIGTLATSLRLADYFTDPGLYAYFGNLIGMIHYELPGVFKNMPTDAVNLQLWIPFPSNWTVTSPSQGLP